MWNTTDMKNTSKKCQREFDITIDQLLAKAPDKLSKREEEFVTYYRRLMPVGVGDCVMNIICRKIENKFDGFLAKKRKEKEFDYKIMKSDADYTKTQYDQIKILYDNYNRRVRDYTVYAKSERVDDDDMLDIMQTLNEDFRAQCDICCPNQESLCNIMLDICYGKAGAKGFVWAMCGEQIVSNLLAKNNNEISIPVQDDNGDILFSGKRFSLVKMKVGVVQDDNSQ